MGQFSKIETDGRLMIVTINRPEVYNACHPMANQELVEAFDEFQTNPDLWVAVITGAGDKAFSAGNDLKYHAEIQAKTGKRPVHPAKGFGGLANRFDLDKPVIAAVNGVAMGGGFEIALACDIIIASDKATFALPEPKVGLAAGAGGMQRLSRMIPLKKAMGMMLTGRHVPAKEGFDLGFVTEVVPHAELMTAAKRWANDILACSPMSVRATKQVVMRSLDTPALEVAMHNQHFPAFVAMAMASSVSLTVPIWFSFTSSALATPSLMPRARISGLVTKTSSPTSCTFLPSASVSSFQPRQSPSAQPSSIEMIG